MMHPRKLARVDSLIFLLLCLAFAPAAAADSVTDCNTFACDLFGPANFDTPTSNRALAIMHTAVYEAVNAITHRYPPGYFRIEAEPAASVDAAVFAATRATLVKLIPAKAADIEASYKKNLSTIPDGQPKSDGVAVGEKAAAAVLSARSEDGFAVAETYRPYTQPGVYVPTALPALPQWAGRKPWLMSGPSQFRPSPPPDLKSERWARDYNETKSLGRRDGSARTKEETDAARFWEATLPGIYHGIVRSVALMPGRDVTRNARLMMAVSQAVDDAMIAVFDAKYQYNFWRPVTAIRNGDIDGNDATERDPSWTPFIDTPMHPEYPCAHCIVAATIGTVLKGEIGDGAVPIFETVSSTSGGASRTWKKLDDFIQEVANARIYDGVHFRNSTEVGTAMGRKIGELAVAKYIAPFR
jgi:hypothetical protein